MVDIDIDLRNVEVVRKGMSRSYGALCVVSMLKIRRPLERLTCNPRRTVLPIGALLEKSMPMLSRTQIGYSYDSFFRERKARTMLVSVNMVLSVNLSSTLIKKRSPCERQHCFSVWRVRTLFPLMSGPGKIPPARTALLEYPSGAMRLLTSSRLVDGP